MEIKKILFIIFLLFISFEPSAQVLFLETERQGYYFQDIFLVNLKFDTGKQRINAVQIELEYSPEKLQLIKISKENSIFLFWPEEPILSPISRKISFVAGVPHGFEGRGEILSLVFKVISQEKDRAEIKISPESILLLNDGFGTKANFIFKNLAINLLGKFSRKKK